MKKLFALILAAGLILSLALPALAEEEAAPETLLERVSRLIADAEELVEMDGDDLYDIIGIDPEDCEDYVYLAAPDALSGRELIIIIAKDEAIADAAQEMLERYLESRIRETRNYLPDAWQALTEASVVREGLTLILSVAAPAADEVQLLLSEE